MRAWFPGALLLWWVCASGAAVAQLPDGKLFTLKRLQFDEQAVAPARMKAPAWTFDARAGARVRIEVANARRVRIRGPKALGGDWNTPWTFDGDAARAITFQIPRSGRYGVFAWAAGKAPVRARLTCVKAPCERATWPLKRTASRIYVVAVGDTGLQPHRSADDRRGGYKYGEYHLFSEMLEGFERFLDGGDLNITNVETAVTSRGHPVSKQYNFRMHANGLRALADAGFDAFAMANNHAGDYGPQGIEDGLKALETLRSSRSRVGYAGIGLDDARAIAPFIFQRGGVRIAFASVGFGFEHARDGPYMAALADLEAVLRGLRSAHADLRILSAHFGSERALIPGPDQRAFATRVMAAGVDILHGHHPHVVQGIERIGSGLVFYSVGNFLLRGGRNMGTLNADMDYGAAVRIGIDIKTHAVRSLEVVPLYDMHRAVFPLEPDAAAQRIKRLNRRSAALGKAGVMLRIDASTGAGIVAFSAPASAGRHGADGARADAAHEQAHEEANEEAESSEAESGDAEFEEDDDDD